MSSICRKKTKKTTFQIRHYRFPATVRCFRDNTGAKQNCSLTAREIWTLTIFVVRVYRVPRITKSSRQLSNLIGRELRGEEKKMIVRSKNWSMSYNKTLRRHICSPRADKTGRRQPIRAVWKINDEAITESFNREPTCYWEATSYNSSLRLATRVHIVPGVATRCLDGNGPPFVRDAL